jgi:NADH-quinone oxidoreductase subunit A
MIGLVGYLVLFLLIGIGFIFMHLLAGKFIRPNRPDPEKQTIYECGEPTIGSAWVQFDLRFYVVALLFVIFDVEVAFFFPWAAVFGQANAIAKQEGATAGQVEMAKGELLQGRGTSKANDEVLAEVQKGAALYAWIAFFDILVFFGVLLVGFAYLWRRGDLQWVRALNAEERAEPPAPPSTNGTTQPAQTKVLAGTGS